MKLLARFGGTLFLRLAALVVLAVLASQVFTLWLTEQQKSALLARQLYAQVLDTLADYEEALDRLPAAERDTFLLRNNLPGLPRLLPLAQAPAETFPAPPFAAPLEAWLGNAVGEPVSVRMSRAERRELWLKVPVLDSHYWLVMPLRRYLPPALRPTLQAAGLVALLSVLAAFALAWRTTRPLSRLANAARHLEAGRMPQAVPVSGPREVRDVIERFNTMALALDKAASERRLMLAGLSHDLRTPLTRLKLAVELQDDLGDKPGMLNDIDELSRIVGQFIDFARSEETRPLTPLALGELVDNVLTRFRRDDMDVAWQRGDATINGDALALQRLLSNLLENARRYGRAPFSVSLQPGASHCELRVHDSGAGIAPELQQAALTPFERLAAHRGSDGGSGLGLAIVSRVVAQHGGSLRFDYPPEGGFAVVITLPTLADAG